LLIAGNIEDRIYYYSKIKPLLLISPNVRYIGEVKGTEEYLRKARALIQTPLWFDAFPLVVLESFASGTPVIALDEGGVSEQIVDGLNGFLCKSVDDIVSAMRRIDEIKPQNCRAYVEEHFSVKRMAKNYIDAYNTVLAGEGW